MPSKTKLYLIPTFLAPGTINEVLPISIKAHVNNLNYYFVENIRSARRFISELGIGKPIEALVFFELTKDTPKEIIQGYFTKVPAGESIGILSEAGCPGIADPGSIAVAHAHLIGMEVIPLTGPSSVFLALMGSGFNGQSFVFHGYIPIEKELRIKYIKTMERDAISKSQTQIFMETPYRNNKLLEDIIISCQDKILFCIACNLTAADQFIKTKTIREWRNSLPDLHKKPAMFLLHCP